MGTPLAIAGLIASPNSDTARLATMIGARTRNRFNVA